MGFYTLTNVGKVRANNEDFAESLEFTTCTATGEKIKLTALILADGMGGAAAGEFASMLAVSELKNCIISHLCAQGTNEMFELDKLALMERYFRSANSKVYSASCENPDMAGMGTTLVSGIILENQLYLAHVGDSRAYKYNSAKGLVRLTKDHSLVQEYVDAGKITDDEAFEHPDNNVITKAIGIMPEVECDKQTIQLAEDDLLMFCSDGLSSLAKDALIADIIKSKYATENGTNLPELANSLIDLANLYGGTDNVTVCLYQHRSLLTDK